MLSALQKKHAIYGTKTSSQVLLVSAWMTHSIVVGATLTAASNGLAIVPRAEARSTRQDQASQLTPLLAMIRDCFTSCSTSRTGFFVCTFSRKMSTRKGIESSLGGINPPGTRNESLPGAALFSRSVSTGMKRIPINALGPYLPSNTGHRSTASGQCLA